MERYCAGEIVELGIGADWIDGWSVERLRCVRGRREFWGSWEERVNLYNIILQELQDQVIVPIPSN
jgi:hypothetical protein